MVVLIGAGLLIRSFIVLTRTDAGFTPEHLVSFNVQFISLPSGTDRGQVGNTLIDRLAQVPGVEAVGASTGLPTVTPQRATRFAIDGLTLSGGQDTAYFIATTPGYFGALRTPVLQGRPIDATDRSGAAPVVVINRALASLLFPAGDALGHQLRIINPEQSSDWRTIVGVVGDVKYPRARGERTTDGVHAFPPDSVHVAVRHGADSRHARVHCFIAPYRPSRQSNHR